MRINAIRDMCAGIAMVLLSLAAWLVIFPSAIVTPQGVDIRALSPDFWPRVIMLMAGLAGLALALQGVIAYRKFSQTQNHVIQGESDKVDFTCESDTPAKELSPARAYFRVAIVVASLLAVYYLIPLIGMVVATTLLLLFLPWFAGEHRWKLILVLAIPLPILLYAFFVHVASIPIPLGIFEEWF